MTRTQIDPRDGRDTYGDEHLAPVASNPLDRARQAQANLRGYRDMDFDTALEQARESGDLGVVDASQAGIGFRLIESAKDKRHLIGVELAVLPGWQVNPGQKPKGAYFTSAYIKTRRPVPQLGDCQEFILNDGSSGIHAQLKDIRERAEARGVEDPLIHCRKGLRVSKYTVTDDLLDEEGNPVIDPITRRPKQVERLDPVTNEKIEGETYYLDTSL